MLPELVVAGVLEALDGRVLEGAVHALDLALIRHDACGACLVWLFSSEETLW